MSLNQLFHDQQVALMRADGAASEGSRSDHAAEAALIGERIRVKQTKLGVRAARAPAAKPAK
jgi:hypothetical protein